MGNKAEENRHRENLQRINNEFTAQTKENELKRYIEQNNLQKYYKQIDFELKKALYIHEETMAEIDNKKDENRLKYDNQRKNDEEIHQIEKQKNSDLHDEKMRGLEIQEQQFKDENTRKTLEINNKHECNMANINNKLTTDIKKIEEESSLKNTQENHRHTEELERIKNEQLQIERTAENEKEKNKLLIQQNQNQHDEKMKQNEHHYNLESKKLDESMKKSEQNNQIDLKNLDIKFEENKLIANNQHDEKMKDMDNTVKKEMQQGDNEFNIKMKQMEYENLQKMKMMEMQMEIIKRGNPQTALLFGSNNQNSQSNINQQNKNDPYANSQQIRSNENISCGTPFGNQSYNEPNRNPTPYNDPYRNPPTYNDPNRNPPTYNDPYRSPPAYNDPYRNPPAYNDPYRNPPHYNEPYRNPPSYNNNYTNGVYDRSYIPQENNYYNQPMMEPGPINDMPTPVHYNERMNPNSRQNLSDAPPSY